MLSLDAGILSSEWEQFFSFERCRALPLENLSRRGLTFRLATTRQGFRWLISNKGSFDSIEIASSGRACQSAADWKVIDGMIAALGKNASHSYHLVLLVASTALLLFSLQYGLSPGRFPSHVIMCPSV